MQPNFVSPPGEFVPLPPGYGRNIRVRAFMVVFLQTILAVVFAGVTLFVAIQQKSPANRGPSDPLWQLNITIGFLPSLMLICLAVNFTRMAGPIYGDSVNRSQALPLATSLRGWWIAAGPTDANVAVRTTALNDIPRPTARNGLITHRYGVYLPPHVGHRREVRQR